MIGLFKTEVIRRRGPWRSLGAVEFATPEWVDWFNTRRLLEPIGHVPPAKAETACYDSLKVTRMTAQKKGHQNGRVKDKRNCLQQTKGGSISLADQGDAVAAYCETSGFVLCQEYCDRGISGRSENRPELQRMLASAGSQPAPPI